MQITVEISFYPLTSYYGTPVIDFVRALKTYEGLQIRTNSMSTQVAGPYEEVMQAIFSVMKKSLSHDLKAAVVLKCFNEKLDLDWIDV